MKKNFVLLFVASAGFYFTDSMAQEGAEVTDEVLLELYRGARVNDVVDGMVTVGYMGVGVMDPKIAPLWKDVKTMEHRFSGIAVTVRYGPTNRPMHPGADLTKPEIMRNTENGGVCGIPNCPQSHSENLLNPVL